MRTRLTSPRGFTLIEVLAVIIILAVLVALLVPALQGAMGRARVTQVRSEISALEAAIARFKVDFNMEPPGSVVLFERAADWNATPPSSLTQNDVVRTRSLLRQMWPQFDFTGNHDFNGDGDTNDYFVLAGAECLVFFLGGQPLWTDTNGNSVQDVGEVVLNGFSKNPARPFSPGGNRQGPYFEFVGSRLVASPPPSLPNASSGAQPAGFFAYLDPLPSQTKPYVYLSSYGGQGYRPSDLGSGGLTSWYLEIPAPSQVINPLNQPAWGKTKYQIISAGVDHEYGVGGPYDPSSTTPLPAWRYQYPGQSSATNVSSSDRSAEADNITNFANGTLGSR